jgi:SAM-dependent methyltransferase
MRNARELSKCRLCSGKFYEASVKLMDSPLANELYPSKELALKADTFPLEIVMCTQCKHIQLKHIVDPERLFSNYVYASGTSTTFRNHFTELAEKIAKLIPGGKVLEVGSNDGTLLEALKARGMMTIGVEPSEHLAKLSQGKCDFMYHDFLNEALCREIIQKHGPLDLVVGNNVFAHIDDLLDAFKNVMQVLTIDGYFIFEVAHVLSLVQNHLFDTIYHEHMSYHSVTSLEILLREIGLNLIEVEEIPTHGGSIRVTCQKSQTRPNTSNAIKEILAKESMAQLESDIWMQEFNEYMKLLLHNTNVAISNFQESTIWFGYGAPAKAVTFINEFNLTSLNIVAIIDDNPEKQEKFLPVSGIGVVSKNQLIQEIAESSSNNDFACIIFPWNLSDEIIEKLPSLKEKTFRAVWFLPTFKEKRINK